SCDRSPRCSRPARRRAPRCCSRCTSCSMRSGWLTGFCCCTRARPWPSARSRHCGSRRGSNRARSTTSCSPCWRGALRLGQSLLAPLVGARGIAVEKERHTFDSLLIQVGSSGPVLRAKLIAAFAAGGLQLVAPLLLLSAWLALGGHLAVAETSVAILGHALHLA